MNDSKRKLFDKILEEIIAELPESFRPLLDELPVIVDDEPPPHVLADLGIEDDGEPADLCGVHIGTPTTERSHQQAGDGNGPLVMLFRGPIFRLAGSNRRELRKEIRITLVHEIAHHFGFSEADLQARGLD